MVAAVAAMAGETLAISPAPAAASVPVKNWRRGRRGGDDMGRLMLGERERLRGTRTTRAEIVHLEGRPPRRPKHVPTLFRPKRRWALQITVWPPPAPAASDNSYPSG